MGSEMCIRDRSLPAINSLLDAIALASEATGGGTEVPAKVFLESSHDDDRELPVAGGDVTWIDRKNGGEALVEAVRSSAFAAPDHFGWVACDNRTTRAIAKLLREDYEIPRKAVKAHAYWAG